MVFPLIASFFNSIHFIVIILEEVHIRSSSPPSPQSQLDPCERLSLGSSGFPALPVRIV